MSCLIVGRGGSVELARWTFVILTFLVLEFWSTLAGQDEQARGWDNGNEKGVWKGTTAIVC